MRIEVIKENKYAEVGCVGILIREYKKSYKIRTSFLACTYDVTIPKEYCEIVRGKTRQEKFLAKISKHFKTKKKKKK